MTSTGPETAESALDHLLRDTVEPGLRPVLAPMARALLPWLVPTGDVDGTGLAEPVGVSGLAPRGPWHRLLASEWALLDEVPLEFVRRAADRELRFLELEREEPSPPARVEIRLDCGPTCLGRPRVVQAAVLLAVAARARASGQSLAWGGLHSDVLFDGLADDWLDTFRSLRTLAAVRVSPGLPGVPSTRWLVGRSVVEGEGTPVVIGQDGDHFSCRIASREVALGRLSTGTAVSVLRPGWRRGTVTPHRSDGMHWPQLPGLLFSPSAARLFAIAADRRTAWAIPVPPRPGRKVHSLHTRGPILAVGWVKQKLVALTSVDDQLALVRKDRVSRHRASPEAVLNKVPRLLVRTRNHGLEGVAVMPPGVLYITAADGQRLRRSNLDGWCFYWDSEQSRAPDGVEDVLGVAQSGRVVRLALPGSPTDGPKRDELHVGPFERDAALWMVRDRVLSFLRVQEDRWRVTYEPGHLRPTDPMVQCPTPPLGVVGTGPERLVVYREDDGLWLRALVGATSPSRLASGVVAAAVSPVGDTVAWRTTTGLIGVMRIADRKMLGKWGPA